MRICENGTWREMTDAETAAHAANLAREKTAPMTADEVAALLISAQINSLAVDDNTALRMLTFYPAWTVGVNYPAGFKTQYGGRLWRCLQEHSAQVGWEPENTPALWEQINWDCAGTQDDPIPYAGNMALEAGKYYMQDGVIWLCIRDTENPVYSALTELAGLYVEEV